MFCFIHVQIKCIELIRGVCKIESITYKTHIMFFSVVIVAEIDVVNVAKGEKKHRNTNNDYSDFEGRATVYLYTIAGNVCVEPNE